jgi:hypothetical protein
MVLPRDLQSLFHFDEAPPGCLALGAYLVASLRPRVTHDDVLLPIVSLSLIQPQLLKPLTADGDRDMEEYEVRMMSLELSELILGILGVPPTPRLASCTARK